MRKNFNKCMQAIEETLGWILGVSIKPTKKVKKKAKKAKNDK